MTSDMDDKKTPDTSITSPVTLDTVDAKTWQLSALSEALGDLTLTIEDSLSIGRGSDNDMVLGSKEVSRNHAILSIANDQLYIKDLESSNGTFINDERIDSNQSRPLESSDTVSFASFSFQVVATDTTTDKTVSTTDDTSVNDKADTTAESISKATAAAVSKSTLLADNLSTSTNTSTDTVIPSSSPSSSEPVVKQTMITEVLTDTNDMSLSSDTTSQTPDADQMNIHEPVVKDTIITDVLAAADSTGTNNTSVDNTNVDHANAPVTHHASLDETQTLTSTHKETVMTTDPAKDTTANEHPAKRTPYHDDTVSPEHDKTTTTELQEEADPDVLRAKQAATGQLSGTANLGGSRDLGTTGNNAMDQTINSAAHTDKKPSGGWFIWVFIIILIIGIALWLFNMGGV